MLRVLPMMWALLGVAPWTVVKIAWAVIGAEAALFNCWGHCKPGP